MTKVRKDDYVPSNAESERPTIFVHSSWRTSSTWFWTCFRRAKSTVSYCEIFNEALATLDCEKITKLSPTAWTSGHPDGAPYFLEFLPLLALQGGVNKYQKTMAVEKFVPASGLGGDLSSEEVEYVGSLIDHARRLEKQPVLTETRTLGRLLALKRQFEGCHIFLHRNLLHQWASYTHHAYAGNPYFLLTIKSIIDHNQQDPFLKNLRELYPLGAPDCRSENYFMAFLLLHIYLYTHAFAHASIAINVTRLARDVDYRKQTCRRILKQTSIELDLETVRSNFEFTLSMPISLNELHDNLLASMHFVQSTQNAKKFETRQTRALIDELIEEMERHRFYAGGVTGIVCRSGGLLDARSERDNLAAERAAFLAERDALSGQRDALVRERDMLAGKLAALVHERDGFVADREALRGECDALMRECGGLVAELETVRGERDVLVGARHVLTLERDGLVAEREALGGERDVLVEERDALRRQLDDRERERGERSHERPL